MQLNASPGSGRRLIDSASGRLDWIPLEEAALLICFPSTGKMPYGGSSVQPELRFNPSHYRHDQGDPRVERNHPSSSFANPAINCGPTLAPDLLRYLPTTPRYDTMQAAWGLSPS